MKPGKAFTLLELLVALAIIGGLAALLFPAIRRAQARARSTVCLGHLRQIGLAVQMYVNDNNSRLPALQNRASSNDLLPAMDTVLLPGSKGVFACPADNAKLFETTGTSYFWNFTVNGQDLVHLFSIIGGAQPDRILLVSDKEDFHPDNPDRVNILYVDGHVDRQLKFSTSLP